MIKKKYIYDREMAQFFIINNAKLLDIDTHNKTGSKFWVFIKDENLEKLYLEWNEKCEKLKIKE